MEIWKSHPEFRDYEFSNFGNFRSKKTGKILKNSLNENGYVVTFLYHHSKQKRVRVRLHRIVGELFIEKPLDPNKNHINHIDGIKTNNHVSNLEWITNQENIQHSIDTGLRKRSPFQKLNEEDVRTIRELYDKTNLSLNDLAKKFDVKDSTIFCIVRYKSFFNVDPDKKYHYKVNQDNKEFLLSKNKKKYSKI